MHSPARAPSIQGPLAPKFMVMLPPHLHAIAVSKNEQPYPSRCLHRPLTAHSAVCQQAGPSSRALAASCSLLLAHLTSRTPTRAHFAYSLFLLSPPSGARRIGRCRSATPRPRALSLPFARPASAPLRPAHRTHPRARPALPPLFSSHAPQRTRFGRAPLPCIALRPFSPRASRPFPCQVN